MDECLPTGSQLTRALSLTVHASHNREAVELFLDYQRIVPHVVKLEHVPRRLCRSGRLEIRFFVCPFLARMHVAPLGTNLR